MPYGNLTVGAKEYGERMPGVYALSTLTFADPVDEIRLRQGSVRKDGQRTVGATRVHEKEVQATNGLVRKAAAVSVSITIPNDGTFTSTEIDTMLEDLSIVLTPQRISEMLQGKN